MIVCLCKAVSDREIKRCISEGKTTLKTLARSCGAGTGCGACHDSIRSMLAETKPAATDADEAGPLFGLASASASG